LIVGVLENFMEESKPRSISTKLDKDENGGER
jgi:hypothetical protein